MTIVDPFHCVFVIADLIKNYFLLPLLEKWEVCVCVCPVVNLESAFDANLNVMGEMLFPYLTQS